MTPREGVATRTQGWTGDSGAREAALFVASYVAKNGTSPTVREVGEHLGVTSSWTARRHLALAVELGFLRQIPGTSRCYVPAPSPGHCVACGGLV